MCDALQLSVSHGTGVQSVAGVVQLYWQLLLQPSPFTLLPSSQTSPGST